MRAELNQDLFFLLEENGYSPGWDDEVFDQVLGQVENLKNHTTLQQSYTESYYIHNSIVAELKKT